MPRGISRYDERLLQQVIPRIGQQVVNYENINSAEYPNSSLLLYGNGGIGSAFIFDSSPIPKTITVFGDTKISNEQSIFGGSSIYFDGTGDYLTAPSNSQFALSGAYTFELWYYQKGTKTADYGIFAIRQAGGFAIDVDNSPRGICLIRFAQAIEITTNTLPTQGAWNHIAVVRNNSNVTSIFLNGTRIGTATITTSYSQGLAEIGAYNAGFVIDDGYISNLRLVKGIAAYDPSSSTITVPNAPFPNFGS